MVVEVPAGEVAVVVDPVVRVQATAAITSTDRPKVNLPARSGVFVFTSPA